ncbi:unnamed protein product, partial [Chrysoparadoxa australica]
EGDAEKQIRASTIIVDNASNYLILHPDFLISPTKVADTVECERRAVLKSRMASSVTGQAAVLGNLKHALFEEALKAALA